MKNKKNLGMVFVIVALLLIAIGGMSLMSSSKGKEASKNKKEEKTYADKVTDINYKDGTKVNSGDYIVNDKELIKQTAKNLGFETATCTEKYCMASVNRYKDHLYQDNFSINYDDNNPNAVNNMSTMLYYSEKDFSYDALYKDVNAIVGSYVGIEISEENLKKMKLPAKSGVAEENNYTDSKFTIQMSLQYIKEKGLYVYRNFIIETTNFE